jgi:AhpD family alkylhydroperoxidase
MNYSNRVFGDGTLTKREKALIALAVTVALKAEHCIQTKISEAKKAGISDDEIYQTMLITGTINSNTMLHTAFEALTQ